MNLSETSSSGQALDPDKVGDVRKLNRRSATFLDRYSPFLCAAAVLLFLALAIGNSMVRAPWWDEGLFTDIALTFRNAGHLGSSVLSPAGYVLLPQVNHYTYWQMPLYPIALGIWLKFVPFSVVAVRLLSVLWGLVYIGAWFVFVRSISRSRNLAFFVAALVALDYSVLSAASDGRMDMMCAALGQAALAAYVFLRDARWILAVSLAAWFGAASLFSHPMGLLTNASLLVLLALDWRRLRWKALLLASLPYLLGIALCAWYASQALDVYRVQVAANSSYRVSTPALMLRNIWYDLHNRYFAFYFFAMTGPGKLKIFSLLFGLVGFPALLLNRELRKLSLVRTLLILTAVAYTGVALLDNQDFPIYFVYTMPLLTACGAVWVFYQRSRGWWKSLAYGLLAASILATVSGFAYKLRQNDYRSVYLPAIAAIRAASPDGGTVMGGSELGYALGFRSPRLVDDRYLGFSSKIEPEVYVIDKYYGGPRTEDFRQAWDWSRATLQSRYHLVFANSDFQVYKRNHDSREFSSR